MRAKQVFTPGGFPQHTFVYEHLGDKEATLRQALDMGNVVISLSGPSKSGKTVFVQSVVGNDSLIHVTGAGVTDPKQVWEQVFYIIGTPLETVTTEERGSGIKGEGKISGKASALFASAEAEGSVGGELTRKTGQSERGAVDHLQLLIRELGNQDFVIFIDDFHYIEAAAQVDLSKQIKEAVRNGVRIVCASVPYHSDDVLRANPDLRGRVMAIDLDYWTPAVLKDIARKGFEALNLVFDEGLISTLADEAAGSPQLMQSLCLFCCYQVKISERVETPEQLPVDRPYVIRVCESVAAMNDYSSTYDRMREGPKIRGRARTSYVLKDDSVEDVYPIVLKAIALDPPMLTFRYNELLGRIESLCKKDAPSGSSVTGTCAHVAFIANESANQSVMEWDESSDVLDIRDPYLLFYLRWGVDQ